MSGAPRVSDFSRAPRPEFVRGGPRDLAVPGGAVALQERGEL